MNHYLDISNIAKITTAIRRNNEILVSFILHMSFNLKFYCNDALY